MSIIWSRVLTVFVLLSVIGAGYGGFRLGVDHEVAARTREDQHVAKAVEAANTASALAISKIKVKNVRITNEVQREIIEKPVYRDCLHSAGGLRLVNESLAGSEPVPAGGGKLPGADPAR